MDKVNWDKYLTDKIRGVLYDMSSVEFRGIDNLTENRISRELDDAAVEDEKNGGGDKIKISSELRVSRNLDTYLTDKIRRELYDLSLEIRGPVPDAVVEDEKNGGGDKIKTSSEPLFRSSNFKFLKDKILRELYDASWGWGKFGGTNNLTENSSRLSPVPDAVVEDEKNGGGDKIKTSFEALHISSLDKNPLEEEMSDRILWTDVRCEPVIDFLHARFFTDYRDVYGYIKIADSQGSDFLAYDRHRFENPQRLYPPGNYLQLSGPEEIPTLNMPIVDVYINNVDTGDVIVHGHQHLLKSTQYPPTSDDAFEKLQHLLKSTQYPPTSDDAFEKLSTLKFQETSGGGHVELQCVAFTFGVYAEVRVFLYNDSAPQSQKIDQDDDDDQNGVEIFGFIFAKCNPMLMAKDKYENHMFNVPKEECEWIEFGGEIVLSKSLVAVPAYSQIEISLDLKGFKNGEFIIVQGSVCFEPSNYPAGRKEVRGVNGYKVQVDVRWMHPSLLNKHRNENLVPGFQAVPHYPGVYASHLVEVFSLFIARPNSEEVKMYGTVDIYCRDGLCNIFKCDKDEAYFLSRGCNLLPMKGPGRAVAPGTVFEISFDLRDVDGHVKIKGTAQSSIGIDQRRRPWFDRRLCSVVKSKKEKSFVAVHYTLFSSALQAVVEVCLVWKRKSSSPVNIYGDIFASYDKVVSYSTTYDKKFFKRVLFSRKKANSEEVFFTGKEAHSEEKSFILSTNLVAVPITSSLLVELNLSFQTAESTHQVAEHVKFQLGGSGKVIPSDDVDICIGVTWKDLP